ncbi:Cellobiose dehydrogenase [Apiospora hydei]|uniref:Cellobiose dehydrogenase n=1 Tax=Apiospora hydei TaxID=1337664 RepID=A0ABR1XCJ8_9PEZI
MRSSSNTLLQFLSLAVLGAAYPTNTSPNGSGDWTTEKYDAIIVGAGTTGIIVADRLSEAGKKTLLLELGGASYSIVGGEEKPAWLDGTGLSRVDVPGLYSTIFSHPSDMICDADTVLGYQACTVGGNSAINAGLYFQPPDSDWDEFHPDGWKSADVKDATQRLLARQPAITQCSTDGKFYLESAFDAAKEWIVDGAGFKNVGINDEYNNKDNVFGRTEYNYIDGQRGGPTRTYLQTALKRSNFRLQTGVRVKYINHVAGAASGVTAVVDGKTVEISVATGGRVVLSAGALSSPGLLMHSGIGPLDTLTRMATANFTPYTVANWVPQPAVGEGLFDNPNTFIQMSSPSVKAELYDYDSPSEEDKENYIKSRSGTYAFASQSSVFWGFIDHEDGTKGGCQGTIASTGHGEFTDNHTITLNIYGTSGMATLGRVTLSDDGKFVPGYSDGIYYKDPRDANDIAKFIYNIFQPAKEGLTPLNMNQNWTVAEIEKYITTPSDYAVGAVNHWSSSCRIGKCVDTDTTVIGTQNIHVIDASIVAPLTVNPQFGAMVAGEKGADRVLALMK